MPDPLSVKCPVCGAEPEAFCTRPDGSIPPWAHRGRDRRAEVRATVAAHDAASRAKEAER